MPRGVSHHFGGVLTSLKKYRAIWGIAAIVSQYRAILAKKQNMWKQDMWKLTELTFVYILQCSLEIFQWALLNFSWALSWESSWGPSGVLYTEKASTFVGISVDIFVYTLVGIFVSAFVREFVGVSRGNTIRGNRTERFWEGNLPLRGSLRGSLRGRVSEVFRGFLEVLRGFERFSEVFRGFQRFFKDPLRDPLRVPFSSLGAKN